MKTILCGKLRVCKSRLLKFQFRLPDPVILHGVGVLLGNVWKMTINHCPLYLARCPCTRTGDDLRMSFSLSSEPVNCASCSDGSLAAG